MTRNETLVRQALTDAFGPEDEKEHDPAVVQIFTALLDSRDAEWTLNIIEQEIMELWIAMNEVLRQMGLREE